MMCSLSHCLIFWFHFHLLLISINTGSGLSDGGRLIRKESYICLDKNNSITTTVTINWKLVMNMHFLLKLQYLQPFSYVCNQSLHCLLHLHSLSIISQTNEIYSTILIDLATTLRLQTKQSILY